MLDGIRVKIIEATIQIGEFAFKGFDKTTGEIILKNGKIIPQILQKEGKKPAKLKDFLNGLR